LNADNSLDYRQINKGLSQVKASTKSVTFYSLNEQTRDFFVQGFKLTPDGASRW
jgi:hypothetical protein